MLFGRYPGLFARGGRGVRPFGVFLYFGVFSCMNRAQGSKDCLESILWWCGFDDSVRGGHITSEIESDTFHAVPLNFASSSTSDGLRFGPRWVPRPWGG